MLPFSVRASGPAFISEVAWAGSSASLADEWLELCGPAGTDLSGWSVEGASAEPLAFPDGSAIPASGAFLIANYARDDARSTLDAAPDLVTTAVSLSNSALAVVLRDAAGNAVDSAGDGGAPAAGTSGDAKSSMERADAAAPWTTASASSGFDAGATESGTPGSCAAPAPDDAPPEDAPDGDSASSTDETAPEDAGPAAPPVEPESPVRVAEIYPSPNSGEREWIELVNPSNVGEFLDGWTVEDAAGTKTRLEGLLLPWGRLVIESPKGSLNNDGDIVVLRDRLGRELDRAAYGKIPKGQAVMRVELQETFVVTLTPTPGAPNVFTEETRDATEPIGPPPAPVAAPAPPSLPSRLERSAVERSVLPAIDPSASLGMTKIETAPTKSAPKKTAAKPKAAASRYKGGAYVATIVVPPGAYSKTRAYVLREGAIEELRFSKAPAAAWGSGDRVSFVAQEKSEGAAAFLLANPNSVRVIGSASSSYAATEAWPEEAGGYRFVAEIASIRGSALEVTLGGIEGDVLVPSGTAEALKPGDTVRVEGFIAPGPRPKVVLPDPRALRLFKTRLPDEPVAARSARLPAAAAIGLTAAAACAGLAAYLRMQRLKRLALTQAPVDEGAWE